VLQTLASGQKTADEVAAACNLQPEPTELLLDALCSIDVVERYGDVYAAAQVMHLLPEQLQDLGSRYWQQLPDFLRTGDAVPQMEHTPLDERDFRGETDASQWLLTAAAMDLVRVLDIGASRKSLRVLELAAGPAVWSLAIAHHDPAARVTVIDLPDRLALARSNAQGIGVLDRLECVESDYRNVQLPDSEYDLAVLANLSHLESANENLVTLKRVHSWLRPGGELAVIDVFPGQDKGRLHHSLYRLNLALRTRRGRLHRPADLQATILQAGFGKPQYAHLPSPPYMMGLMLAGKSDSI
jgi:SAM-dependent methyltransferase